MRVNLRIMVEGQELGNQLLVRERAQRVEHREEDDHRNEHRQAGAHRVDALFAIQLLELLVELLLIILVFGLKGGRLGLDGRHAHGGAAALEVERHDHQLDQDGEDDDRQRVIVDERVQRFDERKQLAMFYALRTFANERLVSQFLTFYHNPEIDPHTLVEPFLWIKNLWMPDSPFATYMPDVQSLRLVDYKVWNDVSAKLVADGVIPQALSFAGAADLTTYINDVVTPFISSAAYAPYIAPVAGLGNLNILGLIRFSIYQEGNGWFLLPILSVVSQIFMQKLTMKNTQMDPSQESSQKMMIYVMTFMSLYFCASYNSAFALYWVVSNIYAIIEQIGFNKYFEQQDRKASKAEEVGI